MGSLKKKYASVNLSPRISIGSKSLPKTKRDNTGDRERLDTTTFIVAKVRYLPKSSFNILQDNFTAMINVKIGKTVSPTCRVWVVVLVHQPMF